jgi:hypothetical protein
MLDRILASQKLQPGQITRYFPGALGPYGVTSQF